MIRLQMTKTITVLYGTPLSSYTYYGPICANCVQNTPLFDSTPNNFKGGNCKICFAKDVEWYEVGSTSHQICFSNNFRLGYSEIGDWYMGCVFLRSEDFSSFSRETLSNIFKEAEEEFGKDITGENTKELISNIEIIMTKLVDFVEIKINEIYSKFDSKTSSIKWEWSNNSPDITKFNLLRQ